MQAIDFAKIKKSLLGHTFLGHFDQGVLFIFLSFHIWEKTENMVTVALAFIIPALVNTVIDYFFSALSDKKNRIIFMIIGNIGSALFLSCYGLVDKLLFLYILIFFKSLFARLYMSSLMPYRREVIGEDDFRKYISKENLCMSTGAAIGGGLLMVVYMFTKNIPLIFIISGGIELFSTVFLFQLKNIKQTLKKKKEEAIDTEKLTKLTVIYALEAFGIALLTNRFIIYLNETHNFPIVDVAVVFFVVFGGSNFLAVYLYRFFKKIPLKHMLMFTFALQTVLLVLFMNVNSVIVVVLLWLVFVLASNITDIYSHDHINKTLFTNIGKRLSKFRVSVSIASICGQLLIGLVWDKLGIGMSFYVSAAVLLVLTFFIVFIRIKQECINVI